jgi:DNA topoisomerase-3
MRLFIAEKPSLARAIAEALPRPHKPARLHIECGGGDVVAWCAGHILQAAPPEAYGAEYKTWRLEHLPIAPREWKLEVCAPELLRSIARLLKTAERVVHAGDPDREGQLLVDEVLQFLGYRGPVDRLLVSDLSFEAIRRQLDALEPNAKYRPLYESALARQRADWLYGLNMTRLYTLLGRAAGYKGVLSVGRVQTPLLGLIVARDAAIARFRPVPYYLVAAELRAGGGERFWAFWVPPEGAPTDEDRRLLGRDVAEAARQRVVGQEGRIAACTEDTRTETPPLPYSLADLQMDAGRRLSMSAQRVLDACQSLYETHRLVTYPRSDCAYLPEGQLIEAFDVFTAIKAQAPALGDAARKADWTRRSKAWNDRKVTAHHAIVPTPTMRRDVASFTESERAVYELVCRRYLAQFYPPHEYLQTTIELEVAGERFEASGRQTTTLGWKALYADPETEGAPIPAEAEIDRERERVAPPPRLTPGARVTVDVAAVLAKRTSPPKPFTDASLIAAMVSVAKFVQSPDVKKILTEADGIGTPATRAAIIETLFDRKYVERVGRTIVSTETGRALVRSLPEVATTPDMTAVWETAMRAITEGTQTSSAFLDRVGAQLEKLVGEGRALGRIAVPAVAPASPARRLPKPSARSARPRRSADTRHAPIPKNARRRPR